MRALTAVRKIAATVGWAFWGVFGFGGAAVASASSSDPFVDRAQDVGIDFEHFAGVSGEWYIPEISGPGCAFVDYDNDGDLDVYLIQGAMLGEGKRPEEATFPPQEGYPLRDRLYRNDMEVADDGTVRLRFTEVTEEAGIEATGYGVGVVTGDYDNDGWIDLFLTNFGGNELWRNRGDGTFEEVIAKAGIDDPRWSAGAAWLDLDRDGWLDLFVGCYLDFSYDNHKICRSASGAQDYCGPQAYGTVTNRLYRNEGDGTFEDVSRSSGVQAAEGKTLGVVTADFNLDGWIDVYVANDAVPNHMWLNQHDGTLLDDALFGGTAVNMDGQSESSMGVDAADYDNDGDEDLFMTHLIVQTNTLYVNDGTGLFEDTSATSGLAAPSVSRTSWGAGFFDYDNDGWLDVITVSGDVMIIEELAAKGDPFPMHQTNQLFHNTGKGTFEDVSDEAGAVFDLSEVSRGVAFGDVDNDGDTDVLLENCQGPARLLINQVGSTNHWLGLRVLSGSPGRDAVGAWVGLIRKGAPTQWRRVRTERGFASASDPRLLYGLGTSADVERIEVHWPDGSVESFSAPEVDRYSTVRQGEGRAKPATK
jgi:hypothetical protein